MPRGSHYPEEIKQRAVELRHKGLTYTEIQSSLNYPIPKNTFTGWFKNIKLSREAEKRISKKIEAGGNIGRAKAWKTIKEKRGKLLEDIYKKVELEIGIIDKLTVKICLSMLYLGEGGKYGEWIRFGNSDPKIVKLFLYCLRKAFSISEKKLRGRVQCRADQNIADLQKFWSELSSIPLDQFTKPQVDKRTIGKPTKRINYKGVFIVEYYSNKLFLEVKFISDIIYKRLNLGPVVYR